MNSRDVLDDRNVVAVDRFRPGHLLPPAEGLFDDRQDLVRIDTAGNTQDRSVGPDQSPVMVSDTW